MSATSAKNNNKQPSPTNNHASAASKSASSSPSIPPQPPPPPEEDQPLLYAKPPATRRVRLVDDGRKISSTLSEGGKTPSSGQEDYGRKASSVSFSNLDSKKDENDDDDKSHNQHQSVIDNSDNDERTPLNKKGLRKKDVKVISDLIDDLSQLETSSSKTGKRVKANKQHQATERIPLNIVVEPEASAAAEDQELKKQRSHSVSSYSSNNNLNGSYVASTTGLHGAGSGGGGGGGKGGSDAAGIATPGITEQVGKRNQPAQVGLQ